MFISIARLKRWKRSMIDALSEVTIISYPENCLNLIATTLGTWWSILTYFLHKGSEEEPKGHLGREFSVKHTIYSFPVYQKQIFKCIFLIFPSSSDSNVATSIIYQRGGVLHYRINALTNGIAFSRYTVCSFSVCFYKWRAYLNNWILIPGTFGGKFKVLLLSMK